MSVSISDNQIMIELNITFDISDKIEQINLMTESNQNIEE